MASEIEFQEPCSQRDTKDETKVNQFSESNLRVETGRESEMYTLFIVSENGNRERNLLRESAERKGCPLNDLDC